jgi:polar amino acid transport system substrate-binding protein
MKIEMLVTIPHVGRLALPIPKCSDHGPGWPSLPLIAGLVVLFFCLGTAPWAEKPARAQELTPVHVGWEEALKPPYLMVDDQGRPHGVMVDMLEAILQKNQIQAIHHFFPWKRCLYGLQEKTLDIVPNSSFTDERTQFAWYTNSFYKTHLMLFYRNDQFPSAPRFHTPEDLKGYRLGGQLGFNYQEYKGIVDIETGSTSVEALFLKLHYGRVDLAISQREVVFWLAREGRLSLDGLGMVSDPVCPERDFHVLTVKNERGARLREILDRGLETLRADGTDQAIHKNYLGEAGLPYAAE